VSATECVWLGADPCEPKHLLAQAAVLAAKTNELLDLIAVGEGASVIDIGCGALGILPTLSDTVGVHGPPVRKMAQRTARVAQVLETLARPLAPVPATGSAAP
jgi:hypothetical protein